jgi:heptosyltransferase-2
MPPGPRVLIVRFSSLGDVVLTTPLLRAIRARHPQADLTFVVRSRYADLLAGNPAVTRVVATAPGEPLGALVRRLGSATFDACVDLQNSPRSWRFRRLLGGTWGVVDRRRLARLALIWLGVDNYRGHTHAVERFFEAARALDVHPDGRPAEVFPTADDEAQAAALIPEGAVALVPGARWANKRWPAAHWRALAHRLVARGVKLVAVGSEDERPLLSGPGVIDAYGLPLRATAAVLRRARLVVANDSGLMHLATAVGRPVIVLVGPTVEAFGYFPYRVPSRVLGRALSCRPCTPSGSDHCPLGHHRCMIEIAPDEVATAVERAA